MQGDSSQIQMMERDIDSGVENKPAAAASVPATKQRIDNEKNLKKQSVTA